jgi:hypothetical protein
MGWRRALILPVTIVLAAWTAGGVYYLRFERYPEGKIRHPAEAITIGRAACEREVPQLRGLADTWKTHVEVGIWQVSAVWKDGQRAILSSPNTVATIQVNGRSGAAGDCRVVIRD